MAFSPRSRTQMVQADTQLLNGIQKHFPSTTFTIQSGPVTTAQVVDALNGRITSAQAVVTAKLGYHAVVVADEQEVQKTDPLVQDVRQSILTMYSTSPQVLSDCGVSPRKLPAPLTPEQKVVRAAKARATRAARGTMSAKKKAAIVGSVPETITISTGASGSGASPPAVAPAPATGGSTATTNGSSTPHA